MERHLVPAELVEERLGKTRMPEAEVVWVYDRWKAIRDSVK